MAYFMYMNGNIWTFLSINNEEIHVRNGDLSIKTSTNRDLVRFNSMGGNETWLDLCKRSKATIAIANAVEVKNCFEKIVDISLRLRERTYRTWKKSMKWNCKLFGEVVLGLATSHVQKVRSLQVRRGDQSQYPPNSWVVSLAVDSWVGDFPLQIIMTRSRQIRKSHR